MRLKRRSRKKAQNFNIVDQGEKTDISMNRAWKLIHIFKNKIHFNCSLTQKFLTYSFSNQPSWVIDIHIKLKFEQKFVEKLH